MGIFLGIWTLQTHGNELQVSEILGIDNRKDSSNQQLNQIPQISNSQAFSLRPLYTLKKII